MRQFLRRPVPFLLAAALTVGVAACGSDPKPTVDSLHGMVPSGADQQVGTFSLPDVSTGAKAPTFTFRAQPRHVLAVYFGYTNCPDACPTAMADLATSIRKLPSADRARIDVAFATVDPGRDTPIVLNAWIDHFYPAAGANVHVLRSTDITKLQAVLSAFGVDGQVIAHGKGGKVDVGHSAVTIFVDAHGVVRLGWPDGVTKAQMRDDLATLLALYADPKKS